MDDGEVMLELLRRRAAEAPGRTFLQEPDGPSATHAELLERVMRWAGAFQRADVAAGDTVLVMVPTSVSAIASWLGIAALRAIEVPVNTQYHGEILKYIINDSRARIMVLHRDYAEQAAEALGACPALELIVLCGTGSGADPQLPVPTVDADAFLAGPSATGLAPARPHDLTAIIYTSGTTGRSKGVMVPWAQLYETAQWATPYRELGPEDVAFLPFPFYHVTVKAVVYCMMLAGGQAVIREKFSSKDYWEVVERYGCTFGQVLGGMARMLMLQPPSPNDAATPMRLMGMVPVLPDLREYEQRFGVRVGTLFNMTELSVPIAKETWSIDDPKSAGRQREGCEARIVDEFDYEVPVGEVGELIVRTTQPWRLNAGYWGMPEETAKAWRNGWFHTGDAFRRDEEGNFYFVDRLKDTIRRRGENISSLEVENVLNAHPAVELAVAVGVPSEIGDEEVKAVVVRRPGETLEAAELAEYCDGAMPRFMVPRYIEFVDALPITATQKVRKSVLRDAGVTAQTWDREAARAGTVGIEG
jgi:crotonobetaine/carnitine-CoA ligase